MRKVDEFEPYDVICRIGDCDKVIVVAGSCDSYCLMNRGCLSWAKKDNIEANFVLLEKSNCLESAERRTVR